jgi:hypothetical protein
MGILVCDHPAERSLHAKLKAIPIELQIQIEITLDWRNRRMFMVEHLVSEHFLIVCVDDLKEGSYHMQKRITKKDRLYSRAKMAITRFADDAHRQDLLLCIPKTFGQYMTHVTWNLPSIAKTPDALIRYRKNGHD